MTSSSGKGDRPSFPPDFFRKLRKAETSHFWFRVRRQWIYDGVSSFLPPPAKLLDAGCGTGCVSSFLAQKGYAVTGCDAAPEAFVDVWPGFRHVQGSATDLPFLDSRFDAVGLFDVIEHLDDDGEAIREAKRVLRPGGVVIVTVPARQELWSFADDLSFHRRRYSPSMLKELLIRCGLRPLKTQYMFMTLYFPMMHARQKEENYSGDPFRISPLLNRVLYTVFNCERILSKRVHLPIGTSLLAIARKG